MLSSVGNTWTDVKAKNQVTKYPLTIYCARANFSASNLTQHTWSHISFIFSVKLSNPGTNIHFEFQEGQISSTWIGWMENSPRLITTNCKLSPFKLYVVWDHTRDFFGNSQMASSECKRCQGIPFLNTCGSAMNSDIPSGVCYCL